MESRLAENIKTFRKERKMTQEQLAEAMGVTVGAVYKWESKQSNPDLDLIIELADLFEVSTDVLLGYEWRNGSMGSARDYLTKAAKQAARFDGMDSSKICESKLFAEMEITNQPYYDNFGRTAMEAAERRVMTDAEFVPQLPAIVGRFRSLP